MNIGLIFPNKDRRYKTIHLGLAYLVAYARTVHNDLNFTILDTRIATQRETKEFFSSDFDLIGMTVFSPVYFEVIRLFNTIKNRFPDVPVVLGGPYVTTMMEEIFEDTPADFAVYGEGEITFAELIDHLKGSRKISEIPGLMYKIQDGEIVKNVARPKIKDLSSIPLPAYDIFPMKRYHYIGW